MGDAITINSLEPFLQSTYSHTSFQVVCFGRSLKEGEFFSSAQGASKQVSAYVFEKDKPFLDNLELVAGWAEGHKEFAKSITADLDYLPLFVLASRHYRIPLPLQLLQMFLDRKGSLTEG